MKQHELCGRTLRLFDSDPYMHSFEAEVIACEGLADGKFSVVLDQTAFFPEAGGQPSDKRTLTLLGDGSVIRVSAVYENGGELRHITEKPLPCGKVRGEINFELRYERMRNHSGEHLLSGAAHRLFGCTNVGFHLNDEAVTVDLDKQLSRERLICLEEEVSRIIAENVPITAYYPTAEELASLDYRSKLELTENVRLVKIGDYDLCACCAPHVSSTAEIGMLLITDSINYKGGTRLGMVCGKNAYKAARLALSNVKEIAAQLSAKASEAASAVSRFIRQSEDEKAKSAALHGAYIDLRLSQLERTEGNIVFFEPYLDRNTLRRLVDKAADLCGGMCAGFSGNDSEGWTYIIISRTVDLKAEAKSLNEKMNGRGGGSSQMIQGSANASRAELEKLFCGD